MRAPRLLHGLPLKVTILLIILTPMAFSQSARLGKSCDLAVLGATEIKSFIAFDRELRSALRTQNAAMMTLLVSFPLRITFDGSSYFLDDAASTQARFQEIFPPAIRRAVLNQRPETISCGYRGIRYGNDDEVWVNSTGHRYAIETINLPGRRSSAPSTTRRVEFTCQTDEHRVLIDAEASGALRYRAWNKPHSLTEKPDLELSKGKRNFEGSRPCGYAIWTFTSSTKKYVISENPGCYSDSEEPAEGSNGKFEVWEPDKSDKPEASWWCF